MRSVFSCLRSRDLLKQRFCKLSFSLEACSTLCSNSFQWCCDDIWWLGYWKTQVSLAQLFCKPLLIWISFQISLYCNGLLKFCYENEIIYAHVRALLIFNSDCSIIIKLFAREKFPRGWTSRVLGEKTLFKHNSQKLALCCSLLPFPSSSFPSKKLQSKKWLPAQGISLFSKKYTQLDVFQPHSSWLPHVL